MYHETTFMVAEFPILRRTYVSKLSQSLLRIALTIEVYEARPIEYGQ